MGVEMGRKVEGKKAREGFNAPTCWCVAEPLAAEMAKNEWQL